MRIIVIGSVAGGTSAAAKARRNSENNEIVIYDMDRDISYSGCGLPYYIGEDYISRNDLTPRNAEWFKKRFNIDIFTEHEVTEIDTSGKKIFVKNLRTDEVFTDYYDKLIFAAGAQSVIPPIPGAGSSNVFTVRNVLNADDIKKFISVNRPAKALIVGGGFIGLEMAENLSIRGMEVTLIEYAGHVMPSFDKDMSAYIEERLKLKGVQVITGDSAAEIKDDGRTVITVRGRVIPADIIIMSAGIKPRTELLKDKGIKTGASGGIIVNESLETGIPDVYAVGDCCEVKSPVTGGYIYRPLGSTANKMGRVAGDVITGGELRFKGVPGTSIFKVFDLSVAQTGITERDARKLGLEVTVSHNIRENRSKYLKGSRELVIKCISERSTEKILGVQIIGEEGVDKRIDVFVTAMHFGAKVSDLFNLDLAYAPPFSITKDAVLYTGMIHYNAVYRGRKLITPSELIADMDSYTIVDVRSREDYVKGHIERAVNIPLDEMRERISELNKSDKIVVHCNKGTTGNAAQNLLLNLGFNEVYNLSGGYSHYKITVK